MKITKVENVSKMKLDFFLIQNNEDVRVALEPGDTSWCDYETTTKSMILYERKNLIKTSEENSIDSNNDEILDKLHTTEDIETIAVGDIYPPDYNHKNIVTGTTADESVLLLNTEDTISNLHTTEDIESKEKVEKKYSGKKRGRKKKRGPKTGSKRNKGNNITE